MQYGKSANERACGQLTLASGIYDENLRKTRAALFSSRQSTVKVIGSNLLGGRLPPPVRGPTKTKADSDQLPYPSRREYGADVRLRIRVTCHNTDATVSVIQCRRSKVFVPSSTK